MNRREVLALASVAGFTAVSRAGCRAGTQTNFLELRITSKKDVAPFVVEEFAGPKQSNGAIRADDEKGLALFLTRTKKDPAGPRLLRMMVATGSTLETVWAAVKAARSAGFSEVRYYGCIPPGCGVPAGGTPDQKRLDGTPLKTDQLDEMLIENSCKC